LRHFADFEKIAMGDRNIATRRNNMARIEQLELDAHRDQLNADVKGLVEKYRSIFEWDIPDIDERASDKLILGAIRHALDAVESSLMDSTMR
jgi:hypothetical protein